MPVKVLVNLYFLYGFTTWGWEFLTGFLIFGYD